MQNATNHCHFTTCTKCSSSSSRSSTSETRKNGELQNDSIKFHRKPFFFSFVFLSIDYFINANATCRRHCAHTHTLSTHHETNFLINNNKFANTQNTLLNDQRDLSLVMFFFLFRTPLSRLMRWDNVRLTHNIRSEQDNKKKKNIECEKLAIKSSHRSESGASTATSPMFSHLLAYAVFARAGTNMAIKLNGTN